MSTHNLCFEQKYEKYQNFSSDNFHFLVVKFSVYLNRRVFVMSFISISFVHLLILFSPLQDQEAIQMTQLTTWILDMQLTR